VAIRAMPLAARITPLILEPHRNPIVVESPEILDQAVVELLLPFAGEERLDRLAPREELRAVAPAAILGISERDAFGIARIPCVFRHARLLRCGLSGERRKRRTGHDGLSWC